MTLNGAIDDGRTIFTVKIKLKGRRLDDRRGRNGAHIKAKQTALPAKRIPPANANLGVRVEVAVKIILDPDIIRGWTQRDGGVQHKGTRRLLDEQTEANISLLTQLLTIVIIINLRKHHA